MRVHTLEKSLKILYKCKVGEEGKSALGKSRAGLALKYLRWGFGQIT